MLSDDLCDNLPPRNLASSIATVIPSRVPVPDLGVNQVKAGGSDVLHSSTDSLDPVSPANSVSVSSKFGNDLIFNSPPTAKGIVVPVFKDCCLGVCDCVHKLDDIKVQIKPCRLASVLFASQLPVSDDNWRLFNGITDGFDITDCPNMPSYDSKNYKSIADPIYKVKMDDIVRNELANGMISVSVDKPHCIRSLGAVPKPGGGMRPITDCSRPDDININCNMNSLVHSFQYKSVDNVTECLKSKEYMAVVDIKNAYRSVPINPSHSKYQGFRWDLDGVEHYYVDRRMCFGLKCGPYYFNLLSEFVHDVLVSTFQLRLVNYLDDFLVIGSSFDECQSAQNKVIQFLHFLGLQISWSKVTPPSQVTTYLGIEIDSVRMELRLPVGKIEKLRVALDKFSVKKSASKHQLEQLCGLLAHCATVVKGGRVFCRRLYDACKIASRTKSKCVRLNTMVKDDIARWKKFAVLFNGKAAIQPEWYSSKMTSDSSMKGFSAYMADDWICGF